MVRFLMAETFARSILAMASGLDDVDDARTGPGPNRLFLSTQNQDSKTRLEKSNFSSLPIAGNEICPRSKPEGQGGVLNLVLFKPERVPAERAVIVMRDSF